MATLTGSLRKKVIVVDDITTGDIAATGAITTNNIQLSGPINYLPDTGTILQVDGSNIITRNTFNGALTIGHDDAVIIAAGDTQPTLNANINEAEETVFIGAEGGLSVHAFPNNDTAWTNRETLRFEGVNGLSIGGANVIDTSGNWVGSDQGIKGQKGQTGAKGITGTSVKGQKGQTGAKGINGTSVKGQKGEVGAKGINGTSVKGATGTSVKGQKGQTGAKGINGTSVKGSTGSKGITGTKGITGSKGITGTSVKGQKGQTGAKGINGTSVKGSTGSKGITGTKGITGSKGSTGSKGQKGQTGAKGINGTKGITGSKGSTGPKGQKGQTGAKGINGTSVKGQKGEVGQKGINGTSVKGQKGEVGQKGNEAGNAGLLDGYDSSRFIRRQNKKTATAGAGWMTVANCGSGRHHGEVVITDADSGDHAFMRIDWVRSYADSSITVINTGGHANRITGARVLYQVSDNTYGTKLLQVYVTTSSVYEVNIYEFGDIDDFGVMSASTPVVQNTITGYALHGTQLTSLDSAPLAAEEGINAGTGLWVNSSQVINSSGVWLGSDQGIKGQKGEVGQKGQTGGKGQKGQTGSKGSTGGKGQKGEVGAKGINGTSVKGAPGASVKGQKGQTGAKGSTGSSVKGQKGQTGAKGINGTSVKGATGASVKGQKGQTGASVKGATGASVKGQKGQTGASVKGSTGSKGITGTKGITGSKGSTGSKGQKGQTGAKGINGTSVKGATGSSVKGQKGEVGAKGINGTSVKGQKGEVGAKGINGTSVKGQKGEVGATGPNGGTTHYTNTGNNYTKFRMWGNDSNYGIGMYSGQGHGSLSDYALTFQMSNTANRGFVFRDSAHTASQAAMSLTTDGRANISYGLRLGYGESDTAANNSTYRLQVSGQIYSTSNITAYSDVRAKENIVDINSALEKVLAMRGVYYNMKESHSQNGEHLNRRVGVIAQEIEKVLPEVVSYDEGEDIYAVDYGNITGILIEAIKDQQNLIQNLQKRIEKLEDN